MKKQFLSFKYAIKGIWRTVKSESHMRFHIVAGFYVLLFSLFYDFSSAQMAVLVILIALILFAEIVNTCIEQLCNLIADRYEPLIKAAKDAAAGAVLVLAAAAAAVGVVFFADFEKISEIFAYFVCNPLMLVPLVISAAASVLFVWLGPAGIKEKLLSLKLKIKK